MFSKTNIFSIATTIVCVAGLTGPALAYTTSMGVESGFTEPEYWSVGDAGSTYQEWDVKSANTGNTPDQGYDTAGATLTDPTHSVTSPGFVTGTSNFYSFSGDFGATADIYNQGGAGGTHVIIQIGASLNPDEESFPGHKTGVFLDSLELTQLDGSTAIAGGANEDALQIAEVSYRDAVSSSFGEVSYQELIYEFYLPGYTGDFQVSWDQIVHATIDTLRVDTMVTNEAYGVTSVPEPATIALLALGGVAMLRRRQR